MVEFYTLYRIILNIKLILRLINKRSSIGLDIYNSKVFSSESKFKEFEPRLKSAKNRFQLIKRRL